MIQLLQFRLSSLFQWYDGLEIATLRDIQSHLLEMLCKFDQIMKAAGIR